MKGLVFTEFLEMVEDVFSPEVADDIIESSKLESGGSYTAIGNYDYHEILELVTHLSQKTDIPVPDLVQTFGKHLFGQFVAKFPVFFENVESSFDLLSKVEDYIHIEVRKLYPDAELPSFEYERPNPLTLKMTYRSTRPFADLAHGLIAACITHFKEDVAIQREDLSPDGTAASFVLIKSD